MIHIDQDNLFSHQNTDPYQQRHQDQPVPGNRESTSEVKHMSAIGIVQIIARTWTQRWRTGQTATGNTHIETNNTIRGMTIIERHGGPTHLIAALWQLF